MFILAEIKYGTNNQVYCGIIFICSGQCSWVAEIFQVHGDVILLEASSGSFYKYSTNVCRHVHGDVNMLANNDDSTVKSILKK